MSIRIAIIGCGYMGRNHLRILSELPGVTVTGVCDVLSANRKWAQQHYHIPVFARYSDLLESIQSDAAVIAVPTSLHVPVASYVLLQDVDVLLEKPIAPSRKEGEQLLKLAEGRKRVLMIGHTERFNPMVRAMKKYLDKKKVGKILQLRVRRLSPYPGRKQDVGVLMDLATHDLDILCFLLEEKTVKIHSIYRKLRSTTYEDVAVLILTFESGIMATINVSWVTPDKVRDIAIEGDKAMIVGNYLTQQLRLFTDYIPDKDNKGKLLSVKKREPLRSELEEFLYNIATRDLDRESVLSAIEAVKMVETAIKDGETRMV